LTLRCFKDFLRVTRNLYLAPLPLQAPRAIQQESAALYPQVFSAVKAFLPDDIEQLADPLFGIGEEREGQRLLGGEFLV